MTEAKFTALPLVIFSMTLTWTFLLIRGINLYLEQQHQLCSWHKSP